MIVPKFNAKRLKGDIGGAIKSIASPIAAKYDSTVKKAVDAANEPIKERLAAQKAARIKAQKKALDSDKTKKPSTGAAKTKVVYKTPLTYKGKKPTQTAIRKQNEAAQSYIIKGRNLTPAQKEQNKVFRSYITRPTKATSVPGQSGGAKGRPNTNAAQKTVKVNTPRTPKPTVNKTGARNVRKATKVTKVTAVPKVKPAVAPGRRKNGAPK